LGLGDLGLGFSLDTQRGGQTRAQREGEGGQRVRVRDARSVRYDG